MLFRQPVSRRRRKQPARIRLLTVEFGRERLQQSQLVDRVTDVVMTEPYFGFALVKLRSDGPSHAPLKLASQTDEIKPGQKVVLIEHLHESAAGMCIVPGRIVNRSSTHFSTDITSPNGSVGGPVINIDSGNVIGVNLGRSSDSGYQAGLESAQEVTKFSPPNDTLMRCVRSDVILQKIKPWIHRANKEK